MRLCLGSRAYDLGSRALVVGLVDPLDGTLADGGSGVAVDRLVALAEGLVADGADVLDVVDTSGAGDKGATGTEHDRLTAAVTAVVTRLDVAVAVTTSSASLAARTFEAGASLGRPGCRSATGDFVVAAAQAGASVVVVATSAGAGVTVVESTVRSLLAGASEAEAGGIASERIVVDAGLHAARTPEQLLALLRASDRFAALGYPLALSPSDPAAAVPGIPLGLGRSGALAAVCVGVALGGRMVRTSDVRGARRACDAIAAVLEAR